MSKQTDYFELPVCFAFVGACFGFISAQIFLMVFGYALAYHLEALNGLAVFPYIQHGNTLAGATIGAVTGYRIGGWLRDYFQQR